MSLFSASQPMTSDTVEDEHMMASSTLICFSHLRWSFVFQRPQHLMQRFARHAKVLFWEEPNYIEPNAEPRLALKPCPESGVIVVTPELPAGRNAAGEQAMLRTLLDNLLVNAKQPVIRWYYTPMMLPFSEHVAADCVVYDCMDELANFKDAPPGLLDLEARLFEHADVVFTGGYSIYEAKCDRHPNIHPFPSSVDVAHFAKARGSIEAPEDQALIPGPRIGFFGVIDERMDLGLIDALAQARPEWSVVIIGPVVKIDPATLPQRPNIHYLGGKSYAALPLYLGGWDVAMMPFAINAATKFISPTKTPEYLAAGRPVASTPVKDVIRHYGGVAGVKIADTPEGFIAACDEAMALSRTDAWLTEVDALLAETSWDKTQAAMAAQVEAVLLQNARVQPIVSPNRWPAERDKHYDVMIVGAGFAGAVMAERLASESGKTVLVVDRRPHIAGNAFDRLDDAGVMIHQYGPHIFHTNSEDIFAYLSRFTAWRPYEHRVLAEVDGMRVPMPINRTTLNMLFDLNLETEAEAAAFLASRAEPVDVVKTSADVVISAIGRELYAKFFQGYTRKQWGMDPSELDKSVTSRVPTRTNTDDRYFTDTFQAMPLEGYTRMFERMLDHPNIDLLLGVEFEEARSAFSYGHLVFTGPIDEYFGFRYGKLPYRSLQFRHEIVDKPQFQDVAVVNYPDERVPYTRVTEYKYLTGQKNSRTSITYEYPSDEGDPYYPIPRPENQALFKRYEALALAQTDVTFVGRLATYRYYNMDQVVGQALATYRKMVAVEPAERKVADVAERKLAEAPVPRPATAAARAAEANASSGTTEQAAA